MTMRAAGGRLPTVKPLPPPMMFPSASNTTPEICADCSVLLVLSFWISPSISPVHWGSNVLGARRTNEMPGLRCVTGPLFPIWTTISSRATGAPPRKLSSPPVACWLSAVMSLMCVDAVPMSRLSSITMLQMTLTSSASCVFDRFARMTPQLTPVPPNG